MLPDPAWPAVCERFLLRWPARHLELRFESSCAIDVQGGSGRSRTLCYAMHSDAQRAARRMQVRRRLEEALSRLRGFCTSEWNSAGWRNDAVAAQRNSVFAAA